ncbi:hypothetical protein FC36_GL001456 [Ligilactobacillus equi DSM 15833 = JCM 10991]|uniref:Uncharacterized protein n=1 Tax=Ligilactobacillus equi DSM 15833 = JCM 10991 TaxID=1423740 RepID=A0A0R1TDU5_9LACO|nr:hypothetical protein FC36_GL001456 [Ligilactobacillus equi DSM 15833 = JCM 10991]
MLPYTGMVTVSYIHDNLGSINSYPTIHVNNTYQGNLNSSYVALINPYIESGQDVQYVYSKNVDTSSQSRSTSASVSQSASASASMSVGQNLKVA